MQSIRENEQIIDSYFTPPRQFSTLLSESMNLVDNGHFYNTMSDIDDRKRKDRDFDPDDLSFCPSKLANTNKSPQLENNMSGLILRKINDIEKSQQSIFESISKSLHDFKFEVNNIVVEKISAFKKEIINDISPISIDIAEIRRNQNEILNENRYLREENVALREKVEHLSKITSAHQNILEKLDGESRKANLVLLGVPENDNLDGAVNDIEKCLKIFKETGVENLTIDDFTLRRLGNDDKKDTATTNCKPILVTFPNNLKARDNILLNTKNLKKSSVYEKIFVKRDSHPTVRKEWGRLFNVFENEKKKATNVGHKIDFDKRKRVILRDGVVIDSWKAVF